MICNYVERPQIISVGFGCLAVTGNLNIKAVLAKLWGCRRQPEVGWIPNGRCSMHKHFFQG